MQSSPKVESSRDYERSGGWWQKVSRAFLDLPPNILYAKVGSRDCSPSQLQIESV
jgi:hypothetical protein